MRKVTGTLVIQAEQNIGEGDETQHMPCSDEEADIFAVYRLAATEGDAELLSDFFTRAEAERFVKTHQLEL